MIVDDESQMVVELRRRKVTTAKNSCIKLNLSCLFETNLLKEIVF